MAVAAALGLLLLTLVTFATNFCAARSEASCAGIVPWRKRAETISIADFGGVGDGLTLNTWPFRKAVYRIEHLRRRGGTLLYVPPGVWLTGSFNLTSHMTLYLARGAVIKATKDTWSWPLVDPLPSYGRGRELPGGRYASLIQGNGLRDVIITGDKGVIDGQGEVWWNMWRQRSLRYTRPHLFEFMHSREILISNIVFKNSPFWNIHPVYCTRVVIRYVSIEAPYDSPNTDGIDRDSSSNVCIEDSSIASGDDAIAIKSGWDEYGIFYGRPSSGITIRRVSVSSPFSGIAIGSEASGGVENILVENVNMYNTGIGLHIKTTAGRGGYVKNVRFSDVKMSNVRTGVRIVGNVGGHPDDKYNPNALTLVDGVTVKNVWGVGVQQPGSIQGIMGLPFKRICLSNVKLWGAAGKWQQVPWKCTDVSGVAMGVQPWPCAELTSTFESTAGARDLGHTPLNWHMRARIILHVTRAMAYIHSQPLATDDRRFRTNVHGNIKPSNVFVGTDFSAHLSDYGFAQLARAVEIPSARPKKPSLTTLEAGSVKKKPSQKGDVFDFGVMMIEVMGGARAPHQIHCILERIDEIRAGTCHFFEYFVEGQAKVQALRVLEVALACTDCSPEARPYADDILAALTDAFSTSYCPV